jgi:acetyl-CoA carboxylase carboxyl transferase subunit alpha
MPDTNHKPKAAPTKAEAARTAAAWQRVQLARHPDRPHTLDYIRQLCTDFVELHGDRQFGDDAAIVGGLARFGDRTVMVIGHQKGSSTKENLARNFGMPLPEGYRKALRLMRHAAKFGFPLITFIDTPGASPGMASEERGQAMAIAENLLGMLTLPIPIVALVVGEGGSGGALALGVADRILMLENAIYAVATPEASATILWHDAKQAPAAAEAMKITAQDLAAFGVVDEVIAEPEGGAHLNVTLTIDRVRDALARHLHELEDTYSQRGKIGLRRLLETRRRKYERIGRFAEGPASRLSSPPSANGVVSAEDVALHFAEDQDAATE